ncbi:MULTISPECIES: hypothetical protein [unclassified Rothia (in: high G+C Gram-positive bacteria)]|uniref:hypothetical protein n=1 Tax=unclassified Rothia (in: high G+C Gram-positive bacteria) TaxID=2689056 RepID=UPI00195C9DDE|nr:MULTISPECIES: hypothetical protein [unclassified Rothia (in: high G+C Gram-positive bacteria)]MBM7052114.1 hypothetical protein [Rothia sp. ZJ1223]QRZ61453.1 hypothetical protein JR346_09565 [Rothia sp. ZJ932]
MSEYEMSKQQHSLGENLVGSIIIALIIQAPLIFVSLLVLRTFSNEEVLIQDIVAISLVSTMVASTMVALIDRAYRIKHDTYVPSGFFPTVYEAFPWVLVTPLVTILLLQTYNAIWLGAVAGIVGGTVPALALGTPWKTNYSDEEYEQKLNEGNQIIKEGFSEIRESIQSKRDS